MKTFKTKQQIIDLVEMANSFATSADYTRLKSIGRKYSLDLIHDKRTNIQLWWNVIYEKMNNLPVNDAFRKDLTARWMWHLRNSTNEHVLDFIKYLGVWHSEYVFLCDPKWDQLEHFATSILSTNGIPTEGGVSNMIKTGGDYFTYFSQFDKSKCDKNALKTSETLFNELNLMFKDKNATERHIISVAIRTFATSFEPMSYEEFHEILFKNQ